MNVTGKNTLWLVCTAALWLGPMGRVAAQSALDGFDPNANGAVRVVVVQPDGKILLGGSFTTLSSNGGAAVTRNRIARLNPDGTLDTAFNPDATGSIRSIAVQEDGMILVSGDFISIGGQARNGIARLDPATGLADSFDPNSIGGSVFSIAVQADGGILAGGNFTNIGGQTRNGIARLDPITGLADSFNPNADSAVYAIAVQGDGKILAVGTFTSIGGKTRHRIARLDPVSGLADSLDPNANFPVYSVAVQADGKVLAVGLFTNIGGQARNFFARLDPATGLADSFDPNPNNPVYSIAVQADGKILAGGDFNGASSVGGQPRSFIARLENDGRVDQTLNLNTIGTFVSAIAVQPDGKTIIGGLFSSVLGVARNNIARLNKDGTLDMAFNPNANDQVNCIAVQPDGKILVGGIFRGANSIGGQTRNFIARLDPVTGLPDSFDPNAQSGVFCIVLQADGKILVGGEFFGANSMGGQTRNHIARLDPTTGLADSFDPNADNPVFSIAVQADGMIVAGGVFTSIGEQARNHIARLNPTTGLADSFNPNANDRVYAVAVQADGKILAGGLFNGADSIGGQTRNRIARLDPATGLADSFDPNANNRVHSFALQADGKILAGGLFNGGNSIGGQTRNRIARLDPTTGLADSFDPNANNIVYSIAIAADGKILVGGSFNGGNSIGGQSRNYFARLTSDTAALQNLTATPTTATWTRGGASPFPSRVSFEFSSDAVNYTPLGNATAADSDWILNGLSLPVRENFYLRARGYHRGGSLNGSESVTEVVRYVFLAVPFQLTTAVSRKTHGKAGSFDVHLPLTGPSGVECRSNGGAYTIVLAFSDDIVSGNASVTGGTGSVVGSPIFAGQTMSVNLTGVADAQTLTLTLSGLTNKMAEVLPDATVKMGVLIADTNGNGTVSASDVAQTKAQSGAPVTVANFRTDINANGSVTASDVAQAKASSGQTLP